MQRLRATFPHEQRWESAFQVALEFFNTRLAKVVQSKKTACFREMLGSQKTKKAQHDVLSQIMEVSMCQLADQLGKFVLECVSHTRTLLLPRFFLVKLVVIPRTRTCFRRNEL